MSRARTCMSGVRGSEHSDFIYPESRGLSGSAVISPCGLRNLLPLGILRAQFRLIQQPNPK